VRRFLRILLNAATLLSLVLCAISLVISPSATYLSHASSLREFWLRRGSFDLHLATVTSSSPWWIERRESWMAQPYLFASEDQQFESRHDFLLLSVERYVAPLINTPGKRSGFTFPVATRIHIRLWVIALIGLSVFAVRALRNRRPKGQGLCPACGYDLRATPDRCPECGATPTATKKTAAQQPGTAARQKT
jgi:hypothetical protein